MTALNAADQRMRAMEEEAAAMTPGEEWIFRAQDDGPSRRVRIIGPHRTPSSVQMEIELLEGPRSGQQVKVGLRRLKGPWSGVEAFDAHDRLHRDLEKSHNASHRAEYAAAVAAAGVVVPTDVMEGLSWPGRGVVVHDHDALASVCGTPFSELVRAGDSIEMDEGLLVSADAFIRIAKAACTAHPGMMTADLLRRERRLLLVPHSRDLRAGDPREDVTTVLHDWCGTQPLETRLHMIALENELSWHRALLRAAVDTLRACRAETVADNLERLSREGPRDGQRLEDQYRLAYEEEPSYARDDSWPW